MYFFQVKSVRRQKYVRCNKIQKPKTIVGCKFADDSGYRDFTQRNTLKGKNRQL